MSARAATTSWSHSPGINRNEGMSGFDWITHKDSGGLSADDRTIRACNGVYADLELDAFDENPTVPFPFTAIDRYDTVEGMSGGAATTTSCSARNSIELRRPPAGGNGARGSVLTAAGIARITGLQDVLGTGVDLVQHRRHHARRRRQRHLQGRAGNDIIDGDRWLNVRIERTKRRPAPMARFDKMDGALNAAMLAGTYNPSQLRIVREILTSTGTSNIDTVRYAGLRADYTITTVGGVVTVTDNDAANLVPAGEARDEGTDTLRNIERLLFLGRRSAAIDVNAHQPGPRRRCARRSATPPRPRASC